MKRFILVVLLLFLLAIVIVQAAKEKIGRDLRQPIAETKLSPTPTIAIDPNQNIVTSVYVPYWALDDAENTTLYDQYIYFGITPNRQGIAQEEGFSRVNKFNELVPGGKATYLALRMVDSEVNADILKDTKVQERIIAQTIAYAKKNNFDGIVLDLEMSAIPFDSLITQINEFTKEIATATKSQNLKFTMTLYGDTFYRVRPFDVNSLSQSTDSFMLMAYDFHKSRSNPGPNFPLKGNEKYGYDMTMLAQDISIYTAPENVTVIFGMFGYDWEVDDKGKATASGVPLTYEQIQAKFLNGCDFTDCQIERDTLSSETSISYIDENNQRHIVWFEDMESVNQKQEYLRTRGISNFSFWAYSYF
jgi:spore germination protein YaaH